MMPTAITVASITMCEKRNVSVSLNVPGIRRFTKSAEEPFYPTRNDARYPRFVTNYYPLHPLFGREDLPVRQRSGATSVAQVIIECEQQCQAVPLWMTDQQRCSAMTIGFDPQCALSSLLELTSLIDAAQL